jgi:hypothetical protein
MVFIYDPDPRFYVTREENRAVGRVWFRLWRDRYVEAETVTMDMDELVRQMIAHRLDPAGFREPTDEERQG